MINKIMPTGLTPEEEKEKARRDALIQKLVMDKIPDGWAEAVYKVTDVTLVRDTMQKVLDDPETPADKKRYIQALFTLGYFDKESVTEKDQEAEDRLNNWINDKLEELIKQGILPDPATDPLVEKINQQYGRTNTEEN